MSGKVPKKVPRDQNWLTGLSPSSCRGTSTLQYFNKSHDLIKKLHHVNHTTNSSWRPRWIRNVTAANIHRAIHIVCLFGLSVPSMQFKFIQGQEAKTLVLGRVLKLEKFSKGFSRLFNCLSFGKIRLILSKPEDGFSQPTFP